MTNKDTHQHEEMYPEKREGCYAIRRKLCPREILISNKQFKNGGYEKEVKGGEG